MNEEDRKLEQIYKVLRPYDHDDFSYNPNVCQIIIDGITGLEKQNNAAKLLILTKILGIYILSNSPKVLSIRLLPEIKKLCMKHKVDNTYHKTQIKKLYNFVYPYGEFNGNYADSCIAINRELKTLCRDNNKDILVSIALGMGFSVNKYDTTNSVCEKLQDIINTSCFSIDDITSARVAANFRLGALMPKQKGELEDITEEEVEMPSGFNTPIYVNENLKQFIANGNFGYIEPNDPSSGRLNSFLQVSKNGVSTRAMLTVLFNIYTHVNKMYNLNKQFLTSTPEMDQYFQETYTNLAARPQRYQKNKVTGQPDLTKPILKFDPKHFRYGSIQSIINDNIIPSSKLSKEQEEYLKNPKVINRLNAEHELISVIRDSYRQVNK